MTIRKLLLAFVLMAFVGITHANLQDGLVACYPFNGNANDESGNGNHGVVHGATLTADRFGKPYSAYRFDGIDDYIEANSSNLPTADRTVSLWFYTNDASILGCTLGYGGSNVCGTSWFMCVGEGIFHMSSHCNVNEINFLYSKTPIGAWYNFVVSTDATGTKMYVNAFEVASNDIFVKNTFVFNKDLAIGVAVSGDGFAPYTDANVDFFQGIIDDVRIYDRALNASEIQAIFNAGSDGQCKPGSGNIGPIDGNMPIHGNVRLANGTQICAMVLANGQYMFSCGGTGTYNLSVPLDANGQITLFAFADGFAPFRVTLGPDGFPRTVEMHMAAPNSPLVAMTHTVTCASKTNWVHVTGTIESYGNQPLCAMVLANGQQMFSCGASLGRYDLIVPVDENGQVTLFGFADGFQPYRETFGAPGCGADGIVPAYQLHGLDFSPYISEDEDPNFGDFQISQEELKTRLAIIQPYTRWIRTFGCNTDLKAAGALAHAMGLKAAIGAWLSRDTTENEKQINCLIETAQQGHADLAIVGSEALLRGDFSSGQLVDYLRRVKAAVPGVPVTYADTYAEFLAHTDVLSAVDKVLINDYGYWEGLDVTTAVPALHRVYQQVAAAAQGKPVIISETGWPSCGEAVGEAVPSLENANYYFLNFVSWARANAARYFYFEAFDEPWKTGYEGPQGACWGLWDKHGNLKPGMRQVFAGAVMSDNWSDNGSGNNNGTGDPVIEFTSVPSRGSFGNLFGRVLNVSPAAYNVAVFIYVGTGWWTKPYWEEPLTAIRSDGTWTADITTGGSDEQSTRVAAFLVPAGYNPPLASGDSTLPAELEQWAVAKIEVTR